MHIAGIQKTSLVDYPGKISTAVFIFGCNLRCGFCHNPELLEGKPTNIYSEKDVLNFINSRKKNVDAVTITGGEPLLYPEIYDFITLLKAKNLSVKIDTNGTNPKLLKKLIDDKLIDFIAMDIKGPLNKYGTITKTNVDTKTIEESIRLIINSGLDYEFRTTVVPILHTENDFDEIAKMLKGAKCYALQQFNPKITLESRFQTLKPYDDEFFKRITEKLKKSINSVELRI